MNRTKKSIKNLCFGLTLQAITVILSFLTRTCMIKLLGMEAVSINSLFTEVIAALSLAELGVGSAIIFNLYKPLAEKDEEKVCQLMNLFKKAYLIIAIATMAIGLVLCPYIQIFVNDLSYSISYVRVVYMLFVAQCASSYLFSYKTALLEADQKAYIASRVVMVYKTLGTLVLIVLLFYTRKYIVYLCANILLTISTNAFISHKVDRMYPYIKKKAELSKAERRMIFSNIKNIFVKQLAGKIVNSTDNILISSIVSTLLVGYYSNYAIIIGVFKQLSDQMNNSILPSMGNLFVSESKEQCIRILYKLTFIFYLIASIAAVGTYASVQYFITIWIGEEYLLEKPVVTILCILLFFYIIYKPLSDAMHLSGYFVIGRNISFVSAAVNLAVSFFLGLRIGIVGIFIGTLATYIIEIISKIYYVFSLYFKRSALKYVLSWLKMLFIFAIQLLLIDIITVLLPEYSAIINFVLMGVVACILVVLGNVLFFYKSDELIFVVSLLKKELLKR